MRLINTKTLEFESFESVAVEDRPEYAILSHRWGGEEVTYKEFSNLTPSVRSKQGLAKILKACETALAVYGLQYLWVDSCCIDKSSSAELSEAINSMFHWYQRSKVCITHLADVTHGDGESLRKSDWFRRGWTLQELLAPNFVDLFDKDWTKLGGRASMSGVLSEITSIPADILNRVDEAHSDWRRMYSVAAKMSWASRRRTTRIEDVAYCLLGLFDVTMPLLYGEGSCAFERLREVIIKHSNDMSILWNVDREYATNPGPFETSGNIEFQGEDRSALKPLGLAIPRRGRMELTALTCPATMKLQRSVLDEPVAGTLALLNCNFVGDFLSRPAIFYTPTIKGAATYKAYPNGPDAGFRLSITCTGKATLEWVNDAGSTGGSKARAFEVQYDLTRCKVETLHITRTRSLVFWGRLQLSPPLRVLRLGQTKYRVIQCLQSNGHAAFLHPIIGMSYATFLMTDDASDEFFIVWGLDEPPYSNDSTKLAGWSRWRLIKYGWSSHHVPWCYIFEAPRRELAQRSRSNSGPLERHIGYDFLRERDPSELSSSVPGAPDRSAVITQRPTGAEIMVSTTAVEFLERSCFELIIEERTATADSGHVADAAGKQSTGSGPHSDVEQPLDGVAEPPSDAEPSSSEEAPSDSETSSGVGHGQPEVADAEPPLSEEPSSDSALLLAVGLGQQEAADAVEQKEGTETRVPAGQEAPAPSGDSMAERDQQH